MTVISLCLLKNTLVQRVLLTKHIITKVAPANNCIPPDCTDKNMAGKAEDWANNTKKDLVLHPFS